MSETPFARRLGEFVRRKPRIVAATALAILLLARLASRDDSTSSPEAAAVEKPVAQAAVNKPANRPTVRAHTASRIVASRLDYWRRTIDERRAARYQQADSDAERASIYLSNCPPLICDSTLEAAAIAHCEKMATEGRVFHSAASDKSCLELVASWDHSDMAKFIEKDRKKEPELDAATEAMLDDATAVEQFAPLDRPEPGDGLEQDKAAKVWESAVTSEVYRLVGAGCYFAPDGTAYICVQLATGTER